MSENKHDLGSDLTMVDAHVIQPEEYSDLPEWTDEMFDAADLYIDGQLIRGGRSKQLPPKISMRIWLDADIVVLFRATGKGWQARMNEALREWVAQHPMP